MTKTWTDHLAHTKHGVPRAIFCNAVTGLREHPGIVAMSLSACRSPTTIRKTVDELHMRLRRRLAAMKREPDFQEFRRGVFSGIDVGGSA
jgi:hypothetical protein